MYLATDTRAGRVVVRFCNDPTTTGIYTLSLHDALPISPRPTPQAERHPKGQNGRAQALTPITDPGPVGRERPSPSRYLADDWAQPRNEVPTTNLTSPSVRPGAGHMRVTAKARRKCPHAL